MFRNSPPRIHLYSQIFDPPSAAHCTLHCTVSVKGSEIVCASALSFARKFAAGLGAVDSIRYSSDARQTSSAFFVLMFF